LQKNNALVWSEAVSTLNEWFAEWDSSPTGPITVPIHHALREITLSVIAGAGFGMHFARRSDNRGGEAYAKDVIQPGFTMSFGDALFTAIDTMFVRVLTPRILYRLPIQSLRRCDAAYRDLRGYIQGMIDSARKGDANAAGKGEEAADLFRRLMDANEDETDGATLSDSELVSNIYVSR
jgi:cytochrome P450